MSPLYNSCSSHPPEVVCLCAFINVSVRWKLVVPSSFLQGPPPRLLPAERTLPQGHFFRAFPFCGLLLLLKRFSFLRPPLLLVTLVPRKAFVLGSSARVYSRMQGNTLFPPKIFSSPSPNRWCSVPLPPSRASRRCKSTLALFFFPPPPQDRLSRSASPQVAPL